MQIRSLRLPVGVFFSLVLVLAGCSGSSSSGPTTTTPTPAASAPSISSVSPSAISAGAGATKITVTGANFTTDTILQIGGQPEATTYVSSTQLTATLTAAQAASGGNLAIVATNSVGSSSSGAPAMVVVSNPAPTITQLSPSALQVGLSSTSIAVLGTNFVPTTVIYVNGSPRSTLYIGSISLRVALTTADLISLGTLSLTAVNPSPGGGTSAASTLTVAVSTATPIISAVEPNFFSLNSGATTVSVTGAKLTSGCVVQWTGSNLATSYIPGNGSGSGGYDGSVLVGVVPASLLTVAGTPFITANCAGVTPPTSNALSVTVGNPSAPTLNSISPTAGPVNTAQTVTLNGTGFFDTTTVTLNGVSVPTTYISSTQLQAVVPASSFPVLGNYAFAINTPGAGTSVSQSFTAYVAVPNNSMIYNSANGLFYLSIPGSAGTPYGNSIVSVDPVSGALGTPIFVGTDPNKMALSSDGTILWVGIDGANAVRQVNLTTGTAGMQFTLGGNAGVYENPSTAYALAALPGSPNSVVVSSNASTFQGALSIYDSGVLRGSVAANTALQGPAYALQVNGPNSEIYAGGSTYVTYTYNASGITTKAATTSTNTFASTSYDEMQIANGIVYTDYGQASDAESGSLLGTFYSNGTSVASGSIAADTTLGKVFIAESSTYTSNGTIVPAQIQIFNLKNYTSTGTSLPINFTTGTSVYGPGYVSGGPNRLTRWGANGLAFRTTAGFYSLRSNLVKDLSSISADLGIALSAPASAATGTSSTYTATVTNNGPSASTNIALTASLPTTGVLVSATPSVGSCSTGSAVSCDLGNLASGATASVSLVVQQLSAGSSPMTVQVLGSENDPATANNQASASVAVTGATYNVSPVITAVSPAAIQAGAGPTTITITGTGFSGGATVQMGGTLLSTSVTNGTSLTAIVPSTSTAAQGWAPITVSNPSPGGGVSNVLPLTTYSVITLGVNHILYDPFSRNIMASVGSGSSSITGNSIVAINPYTTTVGSPVSIGSQPTSMALTSDGQILYTILAGAQSVARYNMLTQQPDFTVSIPNNSSFDGGIVLRGIAAQPGTENTIALDIAAFTGNAIYDFNPAAKTAAIRGGATGPYSGSCISFLDTNDLLAFDTDTSGATLDHYVVTTAGFTYSNFSQSAESTLYDFGCFKISGGLAFANAGGVANPATVPATQLGIFNVSGGGEFSASQSFAPDTSLQRAYYMTSYGESGSYSYSNNATGITAFDQNTYLPTMTLPINFAAVEGATTTFTVVDLIRWGQDGLAALTSGGHLYILNGPVVSPQELQTNTAATLTASSSTTLTHGSGNVLLTLTGSNFVPGVAVMWNGAYRTTTIVDSTHVTVAIPASDLAVAGTASLVADNPGGTASSALMITIN